MVVQYYNPGAGTLIAAPETLLYLPTGIQPAQAGRIFDGLINAPRNLLSALEVMTGVLDPTYLALPEFVLVQFCGPEAAASAEPPHRTIEVACRGQLELVLRSQTTGEHTVTGDRATVWEETSYDEVTWISIGEAQRKALPLILGAAPAGSFYWQASGADYSFAPVTPNQVQAGETSPAAQAEVADLETDLGATLTEVPEDWRSAEPEEQNEPAIPVSQVPGPKSTAPLLPSPPLPTAVVEPPRLAPTAVIEVPLPEVPPTAVMSSASQIVGPGQPETMVISEPYFGSVRFSHGLELDLGGPIVVGRKPTIEGSGALPHARMVTVPSPSKDISRSHLGIHLDQGYVIATDLQSVNGTILRRNGQPDRNLNPNEGTLVLNGDILDLGDGVTLTFSGIG